MLKGTFDPAFNADPKALSWEVLFEIAPQELDALITLCLTPEELWSS